MRAFVAMGAALFAGVSLTLALSGGGGAPVATTKDGLTFLPNVPPKFRKEIARQYHTLPVPLRPLLNVRLGTQEELRVIANPNNYIAIGGVWSAQGRTIPPTCPPRTLWLADRLRDAKYTFGHEIGHVVYEDLVIPKGNAERWKAFFCANGRPVARFWKPTPDHAGFCGNPACGFGDVFMWAFFPGRLDFAPFNGQPCPKGLKDELLAITS